MTWYAKVAGFPEPAARAVIKELEDVKAKNKEHPHLVAILDAQEAHIQASIRNFDQARGLSVKASGVFDTTRYSGESTVRFETFDLVL